MHYTAVVTSIGSSSCNAFCGGIHCDLCIMYNLQYENKNESAKLLLKLFYAFQLDLCEGEWMYDSMRGVRFFFQTDQPLSLTV